MDSNNPAAIRQQLQSHLKLFWILLVVVGANVAATFLPIDRPLRVGVQVALALISAGLVLTFYMHLLSETLSTYVLLACTFFLFAAMMALILVARKSHPDGTEYFAAPAPAAPATEHHVP